VSKASPSLFTENNFKHLVTNITDEQRVLDIYEDSFLLWRNTMTGSMIAKRSTENYLLAEKYPEIVALYDDEEDYYLIQEKCVEILWQKAEAITN
jgi:hypothetical protein